MNISDFDYHLPQELIAQEPARPRDASRLLVLSRETGKIEHRRFRDLPRYLRGDDVVVFNDTRVIRARLRGRRVPGGGRAELLLLQDRGEGVWEALVTPGRRLPPGRRVTFGEGKLEAEILERTPSGGRLVKFTRPDGFERTGDLTETLRRLGEVPLPPYITRPPDDESDYQTVFARRPGAAAAPTAGLHFSPEMVDAVREKVAEMVSVTLHIGVGTFRPVHVERVEDHVMHEESYAIPEETAAAVNRALEEGRRVMAVGTSTVRALEAAAAEEGRVQAGHRATDLFIVPGHRFRVVSALLTNFHLPRSTLLLLVSAFAGRENIMRAYREAVERKYRFLSFGDAMFIT